MTTSILSPCAADLHGNDIQALRDFALEAPWEWRKALTALCDVVRDLGDTEPSSVEEMSSEVARLKEENEALTEKLENLQGAVAAACPEILNVLNAAANQLNKIRGKIGATIVEKLQQDVEEALKDLKDIANE